MIKIDENYFLKNTGVQLTEELCDNDTNSTAIVEGTLTRWSKILYEEINKKSLVNIPDDDKLSEFQITAIKDAICNLGLYYLANGDVASLGGRNADGSIKEIVPNNIIQNLQNAGLIFIKFGGRMRWH